MPFAPQLTPVRRRAGGPPQAAPPPIAPRRDAARSPEPTARRPMRCRRSARVSRVLGRRAPGAAPEGRPRQPARASAALRLLSIAIMPLVTAAAAVDSAAPTSDAQISRGRRTLGAAAAAQVPTTGRRRRGGTCTYCARRRQRAAESPGRVLCAPGRPAVCKRGLLLPVGSQASRKASADCARATRRCAGLFAISGRPLRPAATAGGQLRRVGSIPASVDASGAPFSSCARVLAESPRDILIPKPRAPAPKGSHRRRKVGSRPLPHRHQRWSLDLSGCCSMRGQNVVVRVVHFEMRAMRAQLPHNSRGWSLGEFWL